MRCSSTAYGEGRPIPTKYARQGVVGGKNISIPLSWEEIPEGTRSFALSLIDPHPVASNWIHWLIIDIPAGVYQLAEGASLSRMPAGSKELYNSFGQIGYGGPQPPKGSGPHPYVATVYALGCELVDLRLNSTLSAFEKIVRSHQIASASLTGIYER